MSFLNLEEYYKERDRLVKEGMEYIDACNQAWHSKMDEPKKNKNKV